MVQYYFNEIFIRFGNKRHAPQKQKVADVYPDETRDSATGQAFCHINTPPAADSYH